MRVVELDSGFLRMLLNNTKICEAFPEIEVYRRQFASLPPGPKCCPSKRRRAEEDIFRRMKTFLNTLPTDRKSTFKKMTGADFIQVRLSDSRKNHTTVRW